jgi:hypothetical protein
MATNPYFSQNLRSEQGLYEDIVIESLQMYGQDIYYLPRDILNEDRILGEAIQSRFNSGYKIEMYIDNVDGFDGDGDLFSKFGVEIRDQATFVVSRRRWTQTVHRHDNEITAIRPIEGDLLYIPFSSKLFEITHVEHEQPFYQLQNLPTFKLRCELFEYNDEDFDTGIAAVENIETSYAYTYELTLDSASRNTWTIGETASQTLSDGVVISGEIAKWSDSDMKLHLIHVGGDDGLFNTFATSRQISSDTSVSLVTAVAEANNISSNEANEFFDTLTDFLDFSESNPFGEPS